MLLLVVISAPCLALDVRPSLDPATAGQVREAIGKALEYLIPAQTPEGGWAAFEKPHPAITALVVKCLAQDDRYGPQHPAVKRGLAYVLRFAQPDGGIYVEGEGHNNYHTSVALMALAEMKNKEFAKHVEDAQRYLKELQWDDGEGHESSSAWYGGAGYGKGKRPDLSNTQLMIEALRESGLSTDDPVYQKATMFISRCQMLDGTNDQPFADGAEDGGFVYSPANGGESKAGTSVVEDKPRLRSYGSMTYAGFKSMLYAGLSKEDPRVRAAAEWIKRYYSLDRNPNLPEEQAKQGLYYYYHTFARALDAWGEETIVDGEKTPHPWRRELCTTLLRLQRPDGSWVNGEDRWYEGNPHLVTAYAVLALQTALGDFPVSESK